MAFLFALLLQKRTIFCVVQNNTTNIKNISDTIVPANCHLLWYITNPFVKNRYVINAAQITHMNPHISLLSKNGLSTSALGLLKLIDCNSFTGLPPFLMLVLKIRSKRSTRQCSFFIWGSEMKILYA